MFNMTVEEEKNLLKEFFRRMETHPDAACIIGDDGTWVCSSYHEGKIRIACKVERHNGELRSWRYDHRCDNCGSAFEISSLQADVRLRSSFEVLKSLETPFGIFHVLVWAVMRFRFATASPFAILVKSMAKLNSTRLTLIYRGALPET